MKTIVFTLLCSMPFYICSQNVKQEVLEINKAFLKSKDVALETVTKVFEVGNTKPEKEIKTELYRLNGNYLSKNGASETLINKTYKLNIDKNKKIMIIHYINKHQPDNNTGDLNEKAFNMAMDTVLTQYKAVKVHAINESTNQLEFQFKSGTYDVVKVNYDKSTYQVKDYEILLKPTENSGRKKEMLRYVITYRYFSKEQLQKVSFKESDYVIIKKGMVTPTLKYSGFTIINNLKKNSL